MDLTHILIFSAVASALGFLRSGEFRRWLLLGGSILAIFWLQSVVPLRQLDFWLPLATILLTVIVWGATAQISFESNTLRSTLITLGVVAAIVSIIAALRYVPSLCCLTPTTPPALGPVLVVLVAVAGIVVGLWRLGGARIAIAGMIVTLIAILIILKTPTFATRASALIRAINGQTVSEATALDIRWLGISYVAFRLIHTLIDRLNGRLPDVSLRDFLSYVIFFPTFTAGPIDRIERFDGDLQAEYQMTPDAFMTGGQRIVWGMFKKFVLADMLAIFALNTTNAGQTDSMLWTWVFLYGYTFNILLDFSALSDIAIGLGTLMGLKIPENFDAPYRKGNLTFFWNSWHMTLAQWFRAYWFNPLTRALRTRAKNLPMWIMILTGQVTTMLLIGLWHGITPTFAIWGLWHGVGLFVHNRWASTMRVRIREWNESVWRRRALTIGGVLFTFHFVALGWVWFAVNDLSLAWEVFLRLFNL